MKTARLSRPSDVIRRPGYAAALLVVAATLLRPIDVAATDLAPDGYRLQQAIGKFEDTSEFALEYRIRAPALLRADRLQLAAGTLSDGGVTRGFLSLGPVWRRDFASRGFVDFGFSPTVLSGSRIGGRDLGGSFHFTSSLSVGYRFGDFGQYSLALRAQHTSNGGLNEKNPGLDVVGLRFAVEFPR